VVIDGPESTHPSRVETTLVTMFNGASGPLNGAGSACGVNVSIGVTATVIGDDAVAGVERVKVRSSGLDVVSVNRNELGDCTVEALLVGLSCGAADVEVDNDAPRDDFLGATSAAGFGGDAAGVLGAWSWSSVVGAEPSVLDSAPPALWTVSGSAVDDESSEPELSVSVADESFVDADALVSDCLVDSDELEEELDGLPLSVDEETDELDELEDEELESVGSARATPGQLATAVPTPSATANAPTRPTYLT
jgi:hypothetical protein